MRVTISAPDPGCVEFATRALNAFIKGRGNGEFPNPSGAISNSFFGAECTEKPSGNNKGSLLFIWRPFIKPRCMFTTVKRDELKAIGQEILTGGKAA